MRLAYVEGPLNDRESLATKYTVYANRDEDTQHTTRWMGAKDLKSALSYNMKYEAVKTVSKTSRHEYFARSSIPCCRIIKGRRGNCIGIQVQQDWSILSVATEFASIEEDVL
ncbi:hypothetical protein AVEN_120124-1 [Araneus ventricosus]|uniref:Uncharacterized protein n=1 Tax=Araneus ventricosus TaxID=182803 RepID=A0A4Y2SFR1_ARAVE|nr:hypothetical protein AVEN_120124-1 [Araneus ventricosus]